MLTAPMAGCPRRDRDAVFTDGTSLTVRFGTASASDDSLCYLASSDAPTLVYESTPTRSPPLP